MPACEVELSNLKENFSKFILQRIYIFIQNLLYLDDVLLQKCLYHAKSLHSFFIGGMGICKTFTVMLIIESCLWHYARSIESDVESLLMVYTSKIATNIGGKALHYALHLPLVGNNTNIALY